MHKYHAVTCNGKKLLLFWMALERHCRHPADARCRVQGAHRARLLAGTVDDVGWRKSRRHRLGTDGPWPSCNAGKTSGDHDTQTRKAKLYLPTYLPT